MSSLRIENLRQSYGEVSILEDINISIDSGEFLVLVGPSGCGKSTLLNLIAGLDPISAGNIYINDNMVNDLPPAERDIAMVFQSYALYPNMNVGKNMAFGMEMRGIEKTTRDKEVKKVAEMLQIEHLLHRKPAQLSGGQRQRVAMGRALVRHPQIFLFDEPLSNLDAKLRVEMRAEIKRLHQITKATIVYVTHDQVEALSMATKIVVLNDRIVQQQGSPAEIYRNPASVFVAGFMGSPSMNMISGTVAGKAKNREAIIEGKQRKKYSVPLTIKAELQKGDKVIMGIRPEHLLNAKPKGKKPYLSFEAVLNMVELTGADTYGTVSLGEAVMNLRLDCKKQYQVGDVLTLACDPDNICWFNKETGARLL